MKRDAVAGQIAAWLSSTLRRDDFGRLKRYLFTVRRPGAALPLCLIPVAIGHHPSAEDRARKAKLQAAGHQVVIVRSVAEVQLAIGSRQLAELVERRVEADRRRRLSRRELELIVAMAATDPVRYQPAPAEMARAA